MLQELLISHPLFIYLFFGLFSLAIGSLLNVIIYRLPIMLKAEWAEQYRELMMMPDENKDKINLFFPRSFCPQCKHLIPFWHNVPIISYCFLKGKCRYCRTVIPCRYVLVEVACLLLSLYTAWHFGFTLTLVFALLFVWLLICLCIIDLEHQLLPDSLTLSLLWLGLIANTTDLFTSLPNAVLSAAGAYIVLWLFIKIFYFCTGKVGMGNGDFKLFAAFGAWFGWTLLPLIILISSFTGAIVGIIYLKTTQQSRATPIPFGPFLCAAGLISLFYGNSIWQWYLYYW